MHNQEVAETIEEVCKNYYRHSTDTTRWHELSTRKYINPACRDPESEKIIDEHFIKEAELGHYIVCPEITVKCRVPFFLKEEGPEKFRFIPDYSHPKDGVSINSLVSDAAASVQLMSKLDLVEFVYNDGDTQALGKNDFKSWYRQIPLNRSDWGISVYHWKGVDWIDTRMPWGTRTASKVAHHFSIAISYIANKYIPPALKPCYFNYIDDHIVRAVSIILCLLLHLLYILVCTKYGIKLNTDKTILASDNIIGLGLQLDVKEKTVAVTMARQKDIVKHLHIFKSSKNVQAKYAQKCTGKCEDVSFIMYPLRVYLRHIRNATPPYTHPNQTVTVTPSIVNACEQWIRAFSYFTSRSMKRVLEIPDFIKKPFYSDASNVGYGFHHDTHWAFGAFHPSEVLTGNQNNIRERELFPVLVASQLFGPYWSGYRVHLYIDNENAELALINKDIRSEKSHNLLIRICETMMRYKFELYVDRITTKDNVLADALSRFKINKFKALCDAKAIPIDPAPMLHHRPPFEIGTIMITDHQPIQYDN